EDVGDPHRDRQHDRPGDGRLVDRARRGGAVYPRGTPHAVPDRDPLWRGARRCPGARRRWRVADAATSDDALGSGTTRGGGRAVSVLQWLLASEHWSGENG